MFFFLIDFTLIGKPLEFVRELPHLHFTSAPTEPIVLECELSKRPKENVRWFRNGKPLPSRLPSHICIENDNEQTVHRITFTNLFDDDIGEYIAKVENVSTVGSMKMESKWSFNLR